MSLCINLSQRNQAAAPSLEPNVARLQSRMGTLSRIGKFFRNNPGKITLAATAFCAGAALATNRQVRLENSLVERSYKHMHINDPLESLTSPIERMPLLSSAITGATTGFVTIVLGCLVIFIKNGSW